MAVLDRVAYETRVRPRQAVIAGVGGLALLAAATLQSVGPQAKVDELTIQLITTNKRGGLEVAGAVVNAVGLLGLAATLVFLVGAARARRPTMSPGTRISALVGGVLAAAGGIAYAVVVTIKAHDFVTHGSQTYPQANALLSSTEVAVLQYAGLVGSLLIAIAFVLTSLNAMRVGLLTRFLGYLGIVAAAASLLLIGSAPALVIEVFWLMAVAYLLFGRWPSGDPPAWKSGQAEPWPSGAEIRAQREQAGGRGGGRAKPQAKPLPTAEPAPVGAAAQGTRATTPKRKRKRRR